NLVSSGAELLHSSAHSPGKLGQLLRTEQKKHNKENYHHVRPGEIQDTGDRCSHKRVSVNGSLFFTYLTNLADLYSRKLIFLCIARLMSASRPRCAQDSFRGNGINRGEASLC